jgi:hypothetical protein
MDMLTLMVGLAHPMTLTPMPIRQNMAIFFIIFLPLAPVKIVQAFVWNREKKRRTEVKTKG